MKTHRAPKPFQLIKLQRSSKLSFHSAARSCFNAGISQQLTLNAFTIRLNKWQKSPHKAKLLCVEKT